MGSYFQHQNVRIVLVIFQESWCSFPEWSAAGRGWSLSRKEPSRELNHQTENWFTLKISDDKVCSNITAKIIDMNRILRNMELKQQPEGIRLPRWDSRSLCISLACGWQLFHPIASYEIKARIWWKQALVWARIAWSILKASQRSKAILKLLKMTKRGEIRKWCYSFMETQKI